MTFSAVGALPNKIIQSIPILRIKSPTQVNAILATRKNKQPSIHKKKGDFLMPKNNQPNDFQNKKRNPDPDPYRCEVNSSALDDLDFQSCSATDCTGLIPFLPQSEAELESYAELYPYFCDVFTDSDSSND